MGNSIFYPKISIVTPSFNQGQYLEKTILSVINQNYPNLEYIIIDGGSTDNSIDIIKRYEKHLTYWVSEKDKGQSDAINKGLKKSTGDIFNWLCSDDYLEENVLCRIGEVFTSDSNIMCYTGNLRKFTSTQSLGGFQELLKKSWRETIKKRVVKQPSTFFRTSVIKRLGLLNEKLHYSMDTELLCKFLLLYNRENIFEENDKIIAHYLIHNNSKSGAQSEKFVLEDYAIMHGIAKTFGFKTQEKLLSFLDLPQNYVFPNEIVIDCNVESAKTIVESSILKKSVKIYFRKDFFFAKQVLNSGMLNEYEFDEFEKDHLDFLKKNVVGKPWLYFKIKRFLLWHVKHKHLTP